MDTELNELNELSQEGQKFYAQYPLAMLAIQTLKEVTSRVSILETRIESQQIRLVTIEENIRALDHRISDLLRTSNDNIEANKQMLHLLNEHISIQNKDLRNLLFWVIVSLISVLGFGATFLINHIVI